MEQGVFTGAGAQWQELYQALKRMAEQRLGEFCEHQTTNSLLWKHHSIFAEFRPQGSCLCVAIAADALHDASVPAKPIQSSPSLFAHSFEVKDYEQLPELVEKLTQAYGYLPKKKPVSAPRQKPAYTSIEEYIALSPEGLRPVLEEIYSRIGQAAPKAMEKISWGMPTFYQGENLIHFALAKQHIGIYPGEKAIVVFAPKLAGYKTSKGAIQLPLTKPIPYDLIEEITRFRVKEVEEKHK